MSSSNGERFGRLRVPLMIIVSLGAAQICFSEKSYDAVTQGWVANAEALEAFAAQVFPTLEFGVSEGEGSSDMSGATTAEY